MGFAVLLVLAIVAFLLIAVFARLPPSVLQIVAAAMLVGVSGYAWQGSPGQPASTAVSAEAVANEDVAAIETRRAMSGRFSSDSQWIDLADALGRAGDTETAVTAIKGGLRKSPASVDLWVALGNALVAHGDGLIAPPAEYAFRQAARLSPDHPAPPFFLGLALAQGGRPAEAANMWRRLLARTPADAPWRRDLEARIADLDAVASGGAMIR